MTELSAVPSEDSETLKKNSDSQFCFKSVEDIIGVCNAAAANARIVMKEFPVTQ